jgi:hypothetical protein
VRLFGNWAPEQQELKRNGLLRCALPARRGSYTWQHVRKSQRRKRRGARRRSELINTGTNKLYVRHNRRGTSFKEVEDVGRSLSQDRRRKAKTVAKRGQGDRR